MDNTMSADDIQIYASCQESDGDESSNSSYYPSDEEPEENGELVNNDVNEEWETEGQLHSFTFCNVAQLNTGRAEAPIDYFNVIFNDAFFSNLVKSINDNALAMFLDTDHSASSRLSLWKDTTVNEVIIFLAILFHMGHIKVNRINDYWRTDLLFNLPFRQFMSRDRFLLLLRYLCFSDSTLNLTDNDPIKMVKPILNFFNNLMKNLIVPPKNLTIHENTILWRGNLKLRQNVKGKRHKYGLKMYLLTDSNGITQKMHLYCGRHDETLTGKGHAGKVVKMLMEDYLNVGHSLYMDNFFNSVALAEDLLAQRTHVTGTLSVNRKRNPLIAQTKLNRGSIESRYNGGVCVTNYADKKQYLMISTEHSPKLVELRNKRGRLVTMPKVLLEYKKYMKGVYRKNQYLVSFQSCNKSARWYFKIIIHVFEVMMLNAYLMYKQQKTDMIYYDFRLNIVENLLKVNEDPNRPPTNTRTTPLASTISNNVTSSGPKIKTKQDDDIHLPVRLPKNKAGKTKRKDCRYCFETRNKRKACLFYCPQCTKRPGLCMDCFRSYHNY